MSSTERVVVLATNGEDAPDRVLPAYLVAVAALEQGREVVMFLTGDGVRLALAGYADRIRAGKEPPVARVHARFAEHGGRFFVCPICFKERDLDEAELVPNAELKGATPLLEFSVPGTVTFSY